MPFRRQRHVIAMMDRVRRVFPPSGPGYELFDASVFLVVLGFIGYIFTDPPNVTDQALAAPFRVLTLLTSEPQVAWGLGLAVTGLFGTACSFGTGKWIERGYQAVITVCLFASGSFFMGVLLFGASPRAILSVVLYGWIASGLFRARRLYPFREVPW